MAIDLLSRYELIYKDYYGEQRTVKTYVRRLTDKRCDFRENGLPRRVPRAKIVSVKKVEE